MSAERREALLAEFDRSGQSGAAFARWAGIKYPTFASWLYQRRNGFGGLRKSATRTTAVRPPAAVAVDATRNVGWAEIVLGEAIPAERSNGTPLCGRLPGGASLELDGSRESLRLAAELLRELERNAPKRGGVTC